MRDLELFYSTLQEMYIDKEILEDRKGDVSYRGCKTVWDKYELARKFVLDLPDLVDDEI